MPHSGQGKRNAFGLAVLFVLFSSLVPAASPVFSQDDIAVVSIDTRGSAQVRGGDQARAREGAVRDALRAAVRQALQEVLKTDDPAKLPRGADRVLSRHDRYVDTFSVLDEGLEGGIYHVRLRVAVISDFLVRDLKSMGIRQEGAADAARHRISVRITGIRRFERFVKVREELSRVPGVRQVLPRKVDQSEIRLDIESADPPAVFAKHLESSGFFQVRKGAGKTDCLDVEFLP